MSITLLPDEIFFSGAAVTTEFPYPFQVAIGGHGYFVDTKKMARTTIETTRQGFDPSGEAGEQSLSTEGIWKRFGDDWSDGSGQLNYDVANSGSDRKRFYTSEGIDPWAERGAISLLPLCENKKPSANTNLARLVAGGYLYFVDGTVLRHTTDPTGTTPTFTSVTMGGTVSSICTDGAKVYAAIGTDIEQTTIGSGSKSVFSTQNATVVAFANGRLLAGDGNDLYEIDGAGVATLVWSHFNASATIVAIVGSPTGIFVGVNTGERAEFLFVGFNATTGALAVPLAAGSLNRGESIYAMYYYQGIIGLGTSRGFREAEIVQDRGLAPGPVIETSAAVQCIDADGEYIWYGLTNGGTNSTGLARANLARPTTHPNVPAYATDVMAPATTGTVLSVARFGRHTYFAVSASGLWGEHATSKVASGTLDTGWIRYGTVERLVLHNVDLFHEALHGSIAVSIVSEDGSVSALGESAEAGTVAPLTLLSGQQIDSFAFRLQFTLTRDATTASLGPVLLRWTLRAIVAPVQVERIIVPVILFSVVNNPATEGNDVYFDVNEEFAYLKGLESSRRVVIFQMADEAIPVTVRQVVTPEGDFRGFGDGRAYLDQTVSVHLMTLEV